MLFYGTNKDKYECALNDEGQNENAKIHRILHRNDIYAIVFNVGENKNEIEEKLTAMISRPPKGDYTKCIEWPYDILYDENNNFIGYVINNISFQVGGINAIYITPSISLKKRIEYALSLCKAVGLAHEAGHIIGDFNPRNIRIKTDNDGVVLIDTLAYGVNGRNHFYDNQKEGITSYLAPEIQEALSRHETINFTRESDNFALAIHIAQLLSFGYHPFGLPQDKNKEISSANPSVDERMLKKNIKSLKIIGSVMWSKAITKLFKTAFLSKERPDYLAWQKALLDLSSSLVVCNENSAHCYCNELRKCPFCSTTKVKPAKIEKTKQEKTKKDIPVKKLAIIVPILAYLLGQILQYVIYSKSGSVMLLDYLFGTVPLAVLIISSCLGLVAMIITIECAWLFANDNRINESIFVLTANSILFFVFPCAYGYVGFIVNCKLAKSVYQDDFSSTPVFHIILSFSIGQFLVYWLFFKKDLVVILSNLLELSKNAEFSVILCLVISSIIQLIVVVLACILCNRLLWHYKERIYLAIIALCVLSIVCPVITCSLSLVTVFVLLIINRQEAFRKTAIILWNITTIFAIVLGIVGGKADTFYRGVKYKMVNDYSEMYNYIYNNYQSDTLAIDMSNMSKGNSNITTSYNCDRLLIKGNKKRTLSNLSITTSAKKICFDDLVLTDSSIVCNSSAEIVFRGDTTFRDSTLTVNDGAFEMSLKNMQKRNDYILEDFNLEISTRSSSFSLTLQNMRILMNKPLVCSNDFTIISSGNNNVIDAKNNVTPIIAKNLSIDCQGKMAITGGNGTSENTNGSHGIEAYSLTVTGKKVLTVRGGNGADGMDGAAGERGKDGYRGQNATGGFQSKTGTDGSSGGTGETGEAGKDGGRGAAAIYITDYLLKTQKISNCCLISGTSGNGGKGGNGGRGGNGGNGGNCASAILVIHVKGGNGGRGGNGGKGGKGGNAYMAEKAINVSIEGINNEIINSTVEPKPGLGGSGGLAGFGGSGGCGNISCNANGGLIGSVGLSGESGTLIRE